MTETETGLEFQAWMAEAPVKVRFEDTGPVAGVPCKGIVIEVPAERFSDPERPIDSQQTDWIRSVHPQVVSLDVLVERVAVKLLDSPDVYAFSFEMFRRFWPEHAGVLVSKAEVRSDPD